MSTHQGTIGESGFRVPALIRWPGQIKLGTVENGLFSGLLLLRLIRAPFGLPEGLPLFPGLKTISQWSVVCLHIVFSMTATGALPLPS